MIFKPIPPSSIIVTPFTAHKQWEVNDTSSIQYYHGKFFNGVFSNSDLLDSEKINNNYYEFTIHQSINSMLFRDYQDKPNELLDNTTNKQERLLYEGVHVFSIPQAIYGEKLLKGSVEFNIDLPDNNQQLLYNNDFNLTESVVSYSYNETLITPSIISESIWFDCVANGTCQIYSSSINLSKAGSPQQFYCIGYKIPSSQIESCNYILKFNVLSATYSLPYTLQILAWQPPEAGIFTNLNITDLNKSYETVISFVSGSDAIIMFLGSTVYAESVSYSDISLYKIIEHNIIDDTHGNLIDVSYSQSSYEVKNQLDDIKIADWNFRNGYQKKNKYVSNTYTRDFSIYKNHGLCKNIEFKDGITSTLADFNKYDYKTVDNITLLLQDQNNNIVEQKINLQFYGPDSSIRIDNNSDLNSYNFKRNEDFAVSGLINFNPKLTVSPENSIIIDGNYNSKASFEFQIEGTEDKIKLYPDNDVPITVDFDTTPSYTYQRSTMPEHIYIKNNINKITSYIHTTGSLFLANFYSASLLERIEVNELLNSGELIFPHYNTLVTFSGYNNIDSTYSFDAKTFTTTQPLYCNISGCNFDSALIENILSMFDTYYKHSANNSSSLIMTNNPGATYSTNAALYATDLKINYGWNIIPDPTL